MIVSAGPGGTGRLRSPAGRRDPGTGGRPRRAQIMRRNRVRDSETEIFFPGILQSKHSRI